MGGLSLCSHDFRTIASNTGLVRTAVLLTVKARRQESRSLCPFLAVLLCHELLSKRLGHRLHVPDAKAFNLCTILSNQHGLLRSRLLFAAHDQASAMTNNRSAWQASSPFTVARPLPFPARDDRRPISISSVSVSPGTT
jgi:hypothetical protein